MSMRRPFPEGAGIFETLRTQAGEIAELTRHMRRAIKAADASGISMPDEEVLRSEILACLELNPQELGRLRICISHSGFSVTHDPYEEINTLARLTFHSTSSPAIGEQVKSFPYDWHYQVLDEARNHGFDDAILFNSKNEITETSICNIVFKIDDIWITPPITAGILPGIMRAIAIERVGVTVGNIHVSQLPQIQAAFLLSSLKIAQPVSHIGDFALSLDASVSEFEVKMRGAVQYFSVL
jgi:branched-chain amino acid aminotransferase